MQNLLKDIIYAIRGGEKSFTNISIQRAIFLLAIPMVLEMLMESLFAVVDVYFVSKVSTNAVATIGLTESVLTLIYSVAIGLSMAATAMIARRIGEKNPEQAAVASIQALTLAVVLSSLLGLVGFIFAEDILRLMGAKPDLVREGVTYTRIMFAGNISIMLLFLLNGIFRGAGDASLAMRSLWLANGINILLDPCLILGLGPFPELGLTGAAIATTIGRSTGVAFQLYLLFKGKAIFRIAREHVVYSWQLIKRLIEVAAGGAGQYIIASASWIFLIRIISYFGTEALAGYTIAIRVIIFTILPAWGLANAAATLVGQNLGAGKPDRAEQSVWKTAHYTMMFMLVIYLIYFFFAEPIIGVMATNELVLAEGVNSLRIISIGYVFFAYGIVISQSFNGSGDTITPSVLNVICFWLIQIPLAYLLARPMEFGTAGVYWTIAISESILAVLCIIVFRKGHWKTIQI